jgi:TonB family protein
MPAKIADRDRMYRKTLLCIAPVSVLIILLLFVTSDYVPYSELDKRLGWKGAMRVLPEITILPDTDPLESFLEERKLKSLTSVDLNILDETGLAEGGAKKQKMKEEEETDIPREDGLDFIRTRPMHSDVPYSEDYIILKMVHPVYPTNELINGVEGEVTLELLVNEDGSVENAWILSIIGPKSFEESSLKAVRQFLFQSPIRDGKPAPMSIRFQINFKIL